ncbi:hypothetical protein K501DRAFT_328276 [Backusella circina FSU 941]|nr:hypothetical protein K501DRAFT_328276 [Backusella circina FSU 941]
MCDGIADIQSEVAQELPFANQDLHGRVKMKLTSLLTALSAVVYTASAYSDYEFGSLVKRDHGLPFDTLPSASCSTPTACQNITQPATCRCSNELTTCENTQGQFCWGSTNLNITSCPSIPTACASSFSGTTPSCLCNSEKMLCVDEKNNYCYATITGTGSAAVASAASLPYASSSGAASSGAAASSTVSNPSASSEGVSTNPTAAASGADQLTNKRWIAASLAVLAYIASH